MRKIAAIAFLSLTFAGLASAQVPTSGNVFLGYSYYNTNLSGSRGSLHGLEASVEGKFLPFLGVVGDFSGHYGSENFTTCTVPILDCVTFNESVSEHNYLFGPRVSFSVGKIRPFAQALFGAGHVNASLAGSDTSFATAIGGGLDYRLVPLIAWRFQGDYVQTRFFGAHQNNVRVSTGIVFRF